MGELEFLKSMLQERKEEYQRLLSCCMDMPLACRLEELNELIQIVDVRLEKTSQNAERMFEKSGLVLPPTSVAVAKP